MGNLLTARVGNILTVLLGKVLTVGVGKVLDIYTGKDDAPGELIRCRFKGPGDRYLRCLGKTKSSAAVKTEPGSFGILRMTFRALDGHLWSLL